MIERKNGHNNDRSKTKERVCQAAFSYIITTTETKQRNEFAGQPFLTSMPIAGVTNIPVTKPNAAKNFLAMETMLKSINQSFFCCLVSFVACAIL
jgi:hypothetical protein